MDEIEEWFLMEFGHLGFETTPTMYDSDTFTPIKKVIYNNRMTNITITDLSNYDDIIGGQDVREEYKHLLRALINSFLNEEKETFTPDKRITKFNFINCYGEY